jgi:hypothetical protein
VAGREGVRFVFAHQNFVEGGDFAGLEVALPALRMIDGEALLQGRRGEPDNWLSVGAAARAKAELARRVDREFERKEVGDV